MLKGNRWWPTKRLADVQNYLIHNCPRCCRNFQYVPRNIICGAITTHSSQDHDWRNSLVEYLTHGSNILKRQQKSIAQHSKEARKDICQMERLKYVLQDAKSMNTCILTWNVTWNVTSNVTEVGEHLSIETKNYFLTADNL